MKDLFGLGRRHVDHRRVGGGRVGRGRGHDRLEVIVNRWHDNNYYFYFASSADSIINTKFESTFYLHALKLVTEKSLLLKMTLFSTFCQTFTFKDVSCLLQHTYIHFLITVVFSN